VGGIRSRHQPSHASPKTPPQSHPRTDTHAAHLDRIHHHPRRPQDRVGPKPGRHKLGVPLLRLPGEPGHLPRLGDQRAEVLGAQVGGAGDADLAGGEDAVGVGGGGRHDAAGLGVGGVGVAGVGGWSGKRGG